MSVAGYIGSEDEMVEERRAVRRADGRRPGELRPVRLVPGFLPPAEGSVLIEAGATRVICTATVQENVPPFLRGQGRGWVTAEYGMRPRGARPAIRGRPPGRGRPEPRHDGRGSHGRGPGHGRGKALHPGAARAAARPRRRGDPHAHGHATRDARRRRGEAASPRMIPDRLVVATANRGKLGELRELVAEWGSVAIAGVE